MSHVVASATEIPDSELPSLIEAAKQLGFEFVKDKTTYEWFGKWVNDYSADDAAYKNGIKPEDYGKCVHVFKLPGCKYEVGVYRHPETKNLRLIYDFFGDGKKIQNIIGKNAEKLWTLQGQVWAKQYAREKGLKLAERKKPDGTIELVFTK